MLRFFWGIALAINMQVSATWAQTEFSAPEYLKKYPESITDWDAHMEIKGFDTSFSILSSSGDTDDITMAKRDNRIFLYVNYRLVGSSAGYLMKDIEDVFRTLPVIKTTWATHLKRAATSAVGGFVSLGLIWVVTGTVVDLLSTAQFGEGIDINAGFHFVTYASLGIGAVAAVVSPIIERAGGQITVHGNMSEFMSRLILDHQEARHIRVFMRESRHYGQYLKALALALDTNRSHGCTLNLKSI